jgi:hypothetical protein
VTTNEEDSDEGKSTRQEKEIKEIRVNISHQITIHKKPCDNLYQGTVTILEVSAIYSFIEASTEQCSNYHELVKLSTDSEHILTPLSLLTSSNDDKQCWFKVERVDTFKGFFTKKLKSFLKNNKDFRKPEPNRKSEALMRWWDTIKEDLITILRFEFVFFV